MDRPRFLRIVRPSAPLPSRPNAPTPDTPAVLFGYVVSCKVVGGRLTYYVHSEGGEVLSMAYEWDRMCHQLGWYPLDGLAITDRLPETQPPAPTKAERAAKAPRPKLVAPRAEEEQPSPLGKVMRELVGEWADELGAAEAAERPPVDPRQTSMF